VGTKEFRRATLVEASQQFQRFHRRLGTVPGTLHHLDAQVIGLKLITALKLQVQQLNAPHPGGGQEGVTGGVAHQTGKDAGGHPAGGGLGHVVQADVGHLVRPYEGALVIVLKGVPQLEGEQNAAAIGPRVVLVGVREVDPAGLFGVVELVGTLQARQNRGSLTFWVGGSGPHGGNGDQKGGTHQQGGCGFD